MFTRAQQTVDAKLKTMGWRVTGQTAQHNMVQGNAFVYTAQGSVLVLYPDGTFDRSTAQRTGAVNWRTGWVDQDAMREQRRRQQLALNQLDMICDKLMSSLHHC